MGTLRQEILQSQQTRSDLLKWKLGLVGAIGAVGLGLAGSQVSTHADLVLCAVPLVCVYVDFLCRHLSLRILVIGMFFRTATVSGATDTERGEWATLRVYERYAENARDMHARKTSRLQVRVGGSAFALEDWAVTGSTLVVSAALLIYGTLVRAGSSPDHVPVGWAFIASGVLGLGATIVAQALYRGKREGVKNLPNETSS